MKKDPKPTAASQGATPQQSFRLPPTTMTQLDHLVAAFAAESGRPENRTTVFIQLVHREFTRQAKKAGKK